MDTDKKNNMAKYRQARKAFNQCSITPSHIKHGKKELKQNTIKQYVEIITRLHRRNFSCTKDGNLDDVLTHIFSGKEIQEYHLKYIKSKCRYICYNLPNYMEEIYPNKNSLKVNLVPYVTLAGYLSDHDDKYKILHNFLSKYIIDLNKAYENKRDDNEIDPKDIGKIITDYSIETLLNNANKFDNINEKLIYALYTMLPPRRLEYTSVVVGTHTGTKIKDDTNYLIKKGSTPKYLIWNDYKTSKAYGRIIVDIPPELAEIIKEYLIQKKIKTGDKFLPLQRTNFIRLIKKVFNQVYNADISLRWLRISYSTYLNGLNISNNEKARLALQMGHGSAQSSRYKKII
jgi:hypothetical protein